LPSFTSKSSSAALREKVAADPFPTAAQAGLQ
jgi:hypothetical protein